MTEPTKAEEPRRDPELGRDANRRLARFSGRGGLLEADRLKSLIPFLVVVTLAIAYPWYVDILRDLPAIGEFFPSVGSGVIIIVFTMMAVGLNIVVGYSGLLDLGYVAFYAAGAYMAGWLASPHL